MQINICTVFNIFQGQPSSFWTALPSFHDFASPMSVLRWIANCPIIVWSVDIFLHLVALYQLLQRVRKVSSSVWFYFSSSVVPVSGREASLFVEINISFSVLLRFFIVSFWQTFHVLINFDTGPVLLVSSVDFPLFVSILTFSSDLLSFFNVLESSSKVSGRLFFSHFHSLPLNLPFLPLPIYSEIVLLFGQFCLLTLAETLSRVDCEE